MWATVSAPDRGGVGTRTRCTALSRSQCVTTATEAVPARSASAGQLPRGSEDYETRVLGETLERLAQAVAELSRSLARTLD